MTFPFTGAKPTMQSQTQTAARCTACHFSAVSISHIPLQRARWDWWCRNCIPLKLFYIQEIKAEEEGEVGRNENAFAKLSQDTDLKTSFHWERSPAPCGSTESVYRAVSFHCSCLLDVSAGEIFHSLYSSVLKERSLVDVTGKTAGTAQLSPHISGGQTGQDLVFWWIWLRTGATVESRQPTEARESLGFGFHLWKWWGAFKSSNWKEFLVRKLPWPVWWVTFAKTAFWAGILLNCSIYRPRNSSKGWHSPN